MLAARTAPVIRVRASAARRDSRASSARVVRGVASSSSSSSSSRVVVIPRATDDEPSASTTRADDDEIPIWERRDIERKAAESRGGVPWPAYLLLSVIVLIAATGSVFEYAYKNPIFGVVQSDSGLYAPILGWFVFTGFPLAGWFWKKGIDGANEASEAQDKMDGY
jgi:hypothetical protein